jgi:hypothetical protein
MNTANRDRLQLAQQYVMKMVVMRISQNHGWDINRTLEEISRLEIYEKLSVLDTSLWTDNPIDLAAMVETELRGDTIAPADFFL